MKQYVFTFVCMFICLSSMTALAQKKVNPFDVEAKEYLGTPQSEAAVRRGLDYLASTQQPDGHWNSGGYSTDTAICGLCTLAFLSAGYQPGEGKYGLLLKRAVDWLLDSVHKNGLVARSGNAGPPMYGQGFATLAISELYGMTQRADLRPKLEEAVQLICATQNAEGGWRYQPQVGDADISVTAVQLVALRAAFNAGLKVPAQTVKKAVGYIKRCQNNPDGGFSYIAGTSGSGPARTSAGVTCLYLCGEGSSKEAKNGLHYLREHPYKKDPWEWQQHYMYGMYYGTQAMYQVGGDDWKTWFTVTRDRMVATQHKDGSWQDDPGPEYATAMAVLVLQVPAGYLPIYQK